MPPAWQEVLIGLDQPACGKKAGGRGRGRSTCEWAMGQFRIASYSLSMNGRRAKRTFTEKQTSEKRQQEILLGCREDALPANGAPGSQLTCADWRAQGLRQRR
jgi:hypothetical protein